MRAASLTLRLTALFALLSAAVLLVLGLVVGRLVEQHFEDLDMDVLRGKERLVRHALAATAGDGAQALPRRLADALVGHEDLSLAVFRGDGTPLFAAGAADFPAALLASPRSAAPTPAIWENADGRRFRGFAVAVAADGGERFVVAAAIDLAHHEHFTRAFLATLWGVVLLATVVSGFLGWLAVRRGLAPLQRMRRDASAVTANRLDFRLAADAVPVELAQLAGTLNEMLARLEDSFRRLSDFSSDIAHELRTPVSNLLTQTQVTLSRPRADEAYREVLASNAEELERMARMISDMLFLAKAENGLIVPERQAVDLAREMRELFDFYEAVAEEKAVSLTLFGEGAARGDRLMLRRAFSNLLSNAIRHAPPGGRVVVRIAAADGGRVGLSVENSGEPIAEAHRARLFDRFYRADASRRRSGEEAGLGLAITRSILVAHGGDIGVSCGEGTNVFTLHLPAA
ncbi:MAG: heavy metal sensor histidine kinase [Rhodocyclaceae bacterium]|nr:heavy metal sensor histidine kinase [Rhodocyclaceae bacterium]